jgi:hypothetical protein
MWLFNIAHLVGNWLLPRGSATSRLSRIASIQDSDLTFAILPEAHGSPLDNSLESRKGDLATLNTKSLGLDQSYGTQWSAWLL